MSPAEFLLAGLRLPAPEASPVPVPPGTHCPLTGLALTEGWPIQSIIPSSTGEWLDLLNGDVHGYFSLAAAACIQNDWNLGNRAIIQKPDGSFEAHYPLIARPKPGAVVEIVDEDTADPKRLKTLRRDGQGVRLCWSDLLRQIWPRYAGCRCLLIVATDPKKRVWNRARVGVLGERTPILLFDSSRHQLRTITISMPKLIDVLFFVEHLYTQGFSKETIWQFLPRDMKTATKVGMEMTFEWEERLKQLRDDDHDTLLLACILAQKNEEGPAPQPATALSVPASVSAPVAPSIIPTGVTTELDSSTLGGLFDE